MEVTAPVSEAPAVARRGGWEQSVISERVTHGAMSTGPAETANVNAALAGTESTAPLVGVKEKKTRKKPCSGGKRNVCGGGRRRQAGAVGNRCKEHALNGLVYHCCSMRIFFVVGFSCFSVIHFHVWGGANPHHTSVLSFANMSIPILHAHKSRARM